MPVADPSVIDVLETVRSRYPDVPFLALGQTVFWDEPTKAIWHRLMSELLPEGRLIAGVHDTDYFAKTSAHVGTDDRYVALPHDDGRTRDLWSAAGEMSSLFGSESVPTRQFFLQHGIPFDWIARNSPSPRAEFLADYTTAWGWKGIVRTDSDSVVAHDIPVVEIKDALLDQLDWAFQTSLACLSNQQSRREAERVAATIRLWITDFLVDCDENCRLSDLYQTLLPQFYELLLNELPDLLETTASTRLFRFTSETQALKRFDIVRFFLDPRTRSQAIHAYNTSVAGSGIYPLDSFGEGALPFDVVVPEGGRGTVRITDTELIIETQPERTVIPVTEPIGNTEALARILEHKFGPRTVLVGKAVILADMIAAEHIVLFHESASGYTHVTRRFNELAKVGNAGLTFHPIVRISYPTWDTLACVPDDVSFSLPEHLAAAFGAPNISAREFSNRWRAVVTDQRERVSNLARVHGTNDLLQRIAASDENGPNALQEEFTAISALIHQAAEKSRILGNRHDEYMLQFRDWTSERLKLEERMGHDWRETCMPLRELIMKAEAQGADATHHRHDLDRQIALRTSAFSLPIQEAQDRAASCKQLAKEFKKQKRSLERTVEMRSLRARLNAIKLDAELVRLKLVRDAYSASEGLEHTQVRPTAWWIPFVDPSGKWFEAMVRGTKARFELLA